MEEKHIANDLKIRLHANQSQINNSKFDQSTINIHEKIHIDAVLSKLIHSVQMCLDCQSIFLIYFVISLLQRFLQS